MIRHALYRAKFHLAPYLPLRGPTHIDIELSAACNLACRMCPHGDHEDGSGSFGKDKQGWMTWGMADAALVEARKLGALSVKLNFRGESGLSPILIDAVRYAKALGYVEVMLNTNLTAFSLRRLSDITEAGLDLMIISIDGATKWTYESIRINGDFEKLLRNLRYISGLPNRPRIRINMTVQDKNFHEVDMMEERFGNLCDEIRFNGIRSDNSGERKKCPQPSQRLVIMWDGQVGGCCSNWNNEAIIGQFPQQSLRKIWNGINRKLLLEYAADPNRGGPCKGCLVGDSYAD